MKIFNTIALFVMSVSVAMIAYKLPNLNDFKVWTMKDEIELSEELKGITDRYERLEHIKERRKNNLVIGVSVDSGSLDVSIQNHSVPITLQGPVDVMGMLTVDGRVQTSITGIVPVYSPK